MPLDGVTVSAIVHELREKLLDGRIDKIYQPENDEIILQIRAKGANHRLLMSAGSAQPRIHLTERVKDNPMKPPQFCMVLRKRLSGGKILDIIQPDFERIVEMIIESMNEMGDLSVKRLSVEIMGRHSNIILTDSNGAILDAAKHISFDKSSVRQILPGVRFTAPPGGKRDPLKEDKTGFDAALSAAPGEKIQTLIFRAYNGLSPVMSSEICERAGVSPDSMREQLNGARAENLFKVFSACMEDIREHKYVNMIYLDASGKPKDFGSLPITQYAGVSKIAFDSPSEMTEVFCRERDAVYRMRQKTADLRKLIQRNIERCAKKADIYMRTLEEIKDRENDRIRGELLTANIYSIKKGMTSITVQNFHEEGYPDAAIPLDPNLTPAENAQAYFKKYGKAKRSYAALQEQMRLNNEDMTYLEGVQNAVEAAADESDIADIRDELAETGFIKKRASNDRKKIKKSEPIKFISSDGFNIYVGKNNKQNDELTLRFASFDDVWLHTKDIPGSHVIIKCDGAPVSDTAVREAAQLAAYYSKARQGSQVPVDYTLKKNVKKPRGAKPGMVIYEANKTIYITPEDEPR
ncbi:MAG: NFACT family protein [Clostridiales bacterium]|jgi:predicted ribosome quality control (RQC) complex YloA/Tae2 family protein|nr:NFACT family protein [Clostridiales bacterium]